LKTFEIDTLFNAEEIGVKNLRIYASGQNLLTVTDYTGLDPESTSLIDKGTYPQSAYHVGNPNQTLIKHLNILVMKIY
jgi:hypothetical protein